MQRYPICLKNANYDYILDDIEHRDKIYFKGNIGGNSNEGY